MKLNGLGEWWDFLADAAGNAADVAVDLTDVLPDLPPIDLPDVPDLSALTDLSTELPTMPLGEDLGIDVINAGDFTYTDTSAADIINQAVDNSDIYGDIWGSNTGTAIETGADNSGDFVHEVPNNAAPGQPGYGWHYFDNGTAIAPNGTYYFQDQPISGPGGAALPASTANSILQSGGMASQLLKAGIGFLTQYKPVSVPGGGTMFVPKNSIGANGRVVNGGIYTGMPVQQSYAYGNQGGFSNLFGGLTQGGMLPLLLIGGIVLVAVSSGGRK